MNFVPFSIYNYLNIALSAAFIFSTFIFKIEKTQLFLNIVPLVLIGLSCFVFAKSSHLTANLQKNVVLGSFIGSILISFAPYILQYSGNKELLFSTLAFTILLLINIFFVNLTSKVEK
jgi:uncharacterized membrane protein YjjP (DUF1212 family)